MGEGQGRERGFERGEGRVVPEMAPRAVRAVGTAGEHAGDKGWVGIGAGIPGFGAGIWAFGEGAEGEDRG